MNATPTTILTGFLGAGKTTLLRRVLAEAHGKKIAVIENEFAEANVDAEIIAADSRESIVQMTNGCVCCTIREDLRTSLLELAENRRNGVFNFDHVIIETTGLADPGPVAQTFFMDERLTEAYRLDAILTMVDARYGAEQLDQRPAARRQVGFADRLFISKTDLVEAEAVSGLRQRLVQMNPRAPQRVVHFGDVALSEVFDLRGFNLTTRLDVDPAFLGFAPDHVGGALDGGIHEHHAHGSSDSHARHADDVSSFVFRCLRAFDTDKLERFFARLVNEHGDRLLRYKGILNMHGSSRKAILQGVHQLMSSDHGPRWSPDEARETTLVFIGVDMPKDFILQGLEGCLV